MATVEERITKMLIRYLKAVKGIDAIDAYFGDTNGPYDDGCDTCGHGSTERSFDIYYKTAIMKNAAYIELPGDPLGFFPVLLEFDE
jgi:hypothetical protein